MQLTVVILSMVSFSATSFAEKDRFKKIIKLSSEGDPDAALAELNRMIEKDPDDFEVYQTKFEFFYNFKQLDSIEVLLNQMEQLPTCDHEIVALDRVCLDYGDSARFYSQLLNIDLEGRSGYVVDHARRTIGMLHYSRNNFYDCIYYLDQVKHEDIKSDQFHYFFGVASYMLELLPNAIKNFQKAADKKGKFQFYALYYEGITHKEQGRIKLYEKRMKQAEQVDPEYYREMMARERE